MMGCLPGTTIETEITKGAAERIFTPMFYSGGLVLSQISQITGLEGYIIQNWIKRGYLPPPINKKYTRSQLCRILIINVLKDTLSFDQIAALLSYINGSLTDISDDLIDDSILYSYFTDLMSGILKNEELSVSEDKIAEYIKETTFGYGSKVPFAKKRLDAVMKIMAVCYASMVFKNRALTLFAGLDYK